MERAPNRVLAVLLAGAVALALGTGAAQADRKDCRKAVEAYNMALDRVLDSVRQYQACVAASQGYDKCDKSFDRMDSAQGDFSSAVSEHRDDCPRDR